MADQDSILNLVPHLLLALILIGDFVHAVARVHVAEEFMAVIREQEPAAKFVRPVMTVAHLDQGLLCCLQIALCAVEGLSDGISFEQSFDEMWVEQLRSSLENHLLSFDCDDCRRRLDILFQDMTEALGVTRAQHNHFYVVLSLVLEMIYQSIFVVLVGHVGLVFVFKEESCLIRPSVTLSMAKNKKHARVLFQNAVELAEIESSLLN